MLYAGFWKRTLAYIIDSLILWFVFLIIGLIWIVIRALGDWIPSPAENSMLTDGPSAIFTMRLLGQTLLNWGLYGYIMRLWNHPNAKPRWASWLSASLW